jgi:hypothetical protein
MDGNSATADPVSNQEVPPSNGASANPEGAGELDLKTKVEKLEKQYSDSSREAHRLVEELKQEREARLRLEGSLKSQQQQNAQPGYPDEESYVKFYSDKGLDPEAARSMYRENRATFQNQTAVYKKLTALENLLQFQRQESERAFIETNPEVQKAIEFSKGIPELEALPVADKIRRMKELQQRMGIKIEGRDTTSIKMAASGAGSGGTGRSVDAGNTANLDAEAKAAGFSCFREMDEMSKAVTQQQYQEWKKRWKK